MLNRILLSGFSIASLGLAACDRPPPEAVPERVAEVEHGKRLIDEAQKAGASSE